jgi:hypothetical protein
MEILDKIKASVIFALREKLVVNLYFFDRTAYFFGKHESSLGVGYFLMNPISFSQVLVTFVCDFITWK